MFDALFGWRKASKCKKMIKRVQCRLKLLKNKRCSIVKQLREDVAQLIKIGHQHIALARAEQIIQDEAITELYDLLDNFCEFIVINLSYIRRNKDCPNDINEAVSSLIYASARCGDLPELRVIRKLFGDRYGERFALVALELLPGNLVNRQIREKLSINCVSDDVKHNFVDEIARDYCLRQEILALEYISEQQLQVSENCEEQTPDMSKVKENYSHELQDIDLQTENSRTEVSQIEDSNAKLIEVKAIYVDPSSTNNTILTTPHRSLSHPNSERTSTYITSTSVHQSSPDIHDSPPVHYKTAKLNNFVQPGSHEFVGSNLGTEGTEVTEEHNKVTRASSPESLPQLPEDMVVYLDDIEEFQSSMTKDGDFRDQRLFKFRSSFQPKREKLMYDCDKSYVEQYESWSESPRSRSSRKRSRRRSLSRKKSSIKDIECEIYYEKPIRTPLDYKFRSSQCANHPKHISVEGGERSHHTRKSPKKPKSIKSSKCLELSSQRSSCSCYNCAVNAKADYVVKPGKQEGIYDLKCENLPNPIWQSQYLKPGIGDNGACVYQVFTYPDDQYVKQNEKTEEGYDSSGKQASSNESGREVNSSWTRKEVVPPYVRTMTMPQERSKEHDKATFVRFNSCQFQYPRFVHPKLPDYDDIASKFMALKQEHQQSNNRC